ncbi:MAG: imidazolonepropionase [Bdellovibrio sp.]|nr:imidazolonepropionase [Bdellovibrio sp.]
MMRAVIHASVLYTGAGIRKKKGRRVKDEDLGMIPDGAIVFSVKRVGKQEVPNKIEWVGPTKDLPQRFKKIKKTDLRGRRALIPGLIDCHNHLIFGGDRSDEFALRCAGATYQEIAARGGGIQTTVNATRAASAEELERLAVLRLKELYSFGVRTVEIKSGYGLSLESELKVLKLIPKLRRKFPQMQLTATFLGAHAIAKEMSGEDYFDLVLNKMLPEVARLKLADACDIFVDEGYFTVRQARILLTQAKKLGLKIKIHADELGDTGSASLAAEMGALSADHLLKISANGISDLAKSETVAVLLPGTAFYLKAPHAPARKLLDQGAKVALSTDFNPGTCMCLSLPAVMTIAALYLGMSRSEIFAAVTFNAAQALGLEDATGTLEAGKRADFAVLDFERFEELYYRFAWSPR